MFYKKKKKKKKKAKLFNKKHLVRILFVIFCICYEMRAAIRNMKLGNQQARAVCEWNFSRHMKTKELIRSLHYSAKSMTQVRFHQTFPNPYLEHCQKKPGITECELHIMNSFLSDIIKILLRIIMMQVGNKIKPEIAEEHCAGKMQSTLGTMIEQALEVQKEVNLCFINCTEAFDRVQHDEIIRQLTQLKIDGKDL